MRFRKEAEFNPNGTLTTTTEVCCLTTIVQGRIFGGIRKSFPNWTEQTTERLEGLIFGGTCRSVGIVSNPGHFTCLCNESPPSRQRFRWLIQEVTKAKAYVPHSNATTHIERLQANKNELCTIAMMNTEMSFAQ